MDGQRNQSQVGDKIYALLGCYAACSGDALSPGDGINRLSRNVGNPEECRCHQLMAEARNVVSVDKS